MEKQTNLKKKMDKIGKTFFLGILVMTFFSKTVANMMLPKVQACIPQKGNLSKRIECEGIVQFKRMMPIYSPINSKVLEVYVNEGDAVEKGQALCRMDTTNLENEIKNKQIELEKDQLSVRLLSKDSITINKKVVEEEKKLEHKKLENIQPNTGKSLEIENAKLAVETNESLFEQGLIAEGELRESKIKLANLQQEKMDVIKQEQEEKQTKIDEIEEQLEQLKSEKIAKDQERQLKELDIKLLQQNLSQLLAKKQNEGRVVTSASGIVIEKKRDEGITVQDELVDETQVLMKIGVREEGFEVKFTVDKTINFISKGDEVSLKIGDNNDIQGKVDYIKAGNENQEIFVSFKDLKVQNGEMAKATFKQEDIVYHNVIPYSALYKEKDYHYVFTIQSVDDALGDAYIIKKKKVYIEAYNDEYVAIADGVNALDWVMVTSEREIKEGTRVRVENENEVLRNE